MTTRLSICAVLCVTGVLVGPREVRGVLTCPPLAPGTVGTCAEMCNDDASCGLGQKCCSNGCGRACTDVVSIDEPIRCPAVACLNPQKCEFGHVTDSRGCPTCECKLSPCALVRCAGQCTVVDGRAHCAPIDEPTGCESHRCPQGQHCEMLYPPCAPGSTVCEPVPSCVACPALRCKECEFGNVMDDNGCRTCECKDNPCTKIDCPPEMECHLEKVVCVTAPCPPRPVCKPVVQNDDPCVGHECPSGTVCKAHQVLCITTPCPRVAECEPVTNDDPCMLMMCSAGTVCKKVADGRAECVPACPALRCLECEFGNVIDENGCRTCECKDNPCMLMRCAEGTVCKKGQCVPDDCLTPACDLACRNGYVIGRDGCALCECKPVPDPCPLVRCAAPCEFGYHHTAAGCQTCECNKNPCEGHRCEPNQRCVVEKVVCIRAPCPPVAVCVGAEDPCPRLACKIRCEFGFHHTADGCQTCECLSNPCESHKCEPNQKCDLEYPRCLSPPCRPVPVCREACPELTCRLMCPAGFHKDPNGCDICRCINPCALMRCRSGYQCKVEGGQAQCVRACRPRFCFRSCEFGNVMDSNGCKTCRCNPDPCTRAQCASNQECVHEKVPCDSATCYPEAVCQDVAEDDNACRPLSCRCLYGHEQDDRGCQTCTCLTNPCQTMDCPRMCLPIPTPCDRTPCPLQGVCINDWSEWFRLLFGSFTG